MSAVGFDLFAQMLEQAVAATREGDTAAADGLPPALSDITVNLPGHTYLPEEYVPDTDERVLWYRKIASAATMEDVEAIEQDMLAKRPEMPAAARNLFAKARVKAFANEHHMSTVTVAGGKLIVEPVAVPRDKMVPIRRAGGRYLAEKRKLTLPTRYFKVEEGDALFGAVLDFLKEPQQWGRRVESAFSLAWCARSRAVRSGASRVRARSTCSRTTTSTPPSSPRPACSARARCS